MTYEGPLSGGPFCHFRMPARIKYPRKIKRRLGGAQGGAFASRHCQFTGQDLVEKRLSQRLAEVVIIIPVFTRRIPTFVAREQVPPFRDVVEYDLALLPSSTVK